MLADLLAHYFLQNFSGEAKKTDRFTIKSNYMKRPFVIVPVFTSISKPICYQAQVQVLTEWAVVVRVKNSLLKQRGK